MFQTYSVRCSDGTDARCAKHVNVKCSILGLTAAQLEELSNHYGLANLELTAKQIQLSGIQLTKQEEENLQRDKIVVRQVSVIGQTVCGPCETGYTEEDIPHRQE